MLMGEGLGWGGGGGGSPVLILNKGVFKGGGEGKCSFDISTHIEKKEKCVFVLKGPVLRGVGVWVGGGGGGGGGGEGVYTG